LKFTNFKTLLSLYLEDLKSQLKEKSMIIEFGEFQPLLSKMYVEHRYTPLDGTSVVKT
jgi:hypothetical protein